MTIPTLETRGLTKRFGGLTAVDDLSLSLPGGQLHAIIGPNGAGKTTLLNCISGIQPSTGRILLDGQDPAGLSVSERPAASLVRRGLFSRTQHHRPVGP